MDATALGYMFPRLTITLNNGSGDVNYLYPHSSLDGGTHTGYVTAFKETNLFQVAAASGSGNGYFGGAQLVGTSYTGNIIKQPAFSWVSTPLQ